jgi:hypothetical protein
MVNAHQQPDHAPLFFCFLCWLVEIGLYNLTGATKQKKKDEKRNYINKMEMVVLCICGRNGRKVFLCGGGG